MARPSMSCAGHGDFRGFALAANWWSNVNALDRQHRRVFPASVHAFLTRHNDLHTVVAARNPDWWSSCADSRSVSGGGIEKFIIRRRHQADRGTNKPSCVTMRGGGGGHWCPRSPGYWFEPIGGGRKWFRRSGRSGTGCSVGAAAAFRSCRLRWSPFVVGMVFVVGAARPVSVEGMGFDRHVAGRFLFQIHCGNEGKGIGGRLDFASNRLSSPTSFTTVPRSITPRTL